MNAELGSGFVALGLSGSLLGVLNAVRGIATTNSKYLVRSCWCVLVVGVAAVGQFAVMERALITRDFTVAFVAENGSHRTPPLFNVATLWSALEGSILLWVLVLAGYTVLVAWWLRKRLQDPMVGWVLLVLQVVCALFFAL